MNLKTPMIRAMEKPIEYPTRHRAFRSHPQETSRIFRERRRSAKTISSDAEYAVSEAFQQQAAALLSQQLAAGTRPVIAEAHRKVFALSALVDEIIKQMATLPLERRLKFFRSSVTIVAEVLAAMHRESLRRNSGVYPV
jgi:predicted GTPase